MVSKTMQAYEREVSQSGRNNGVKLKFYTKSIEADVGAEADNTLSPGAGQALIFVNEWLAVIADSIVGLFIARILALESYKATGSITASRAQLYADVDYLWYEAHILLKYIYSIMALFFTVLMY
ncbi:hypothetical protein EON65_03390 [archaeon]|nr:MAG: hypothetical protein EON65_03390 [archaeon]